MSTWWRGCEGCRICGGNDGGGRYGGGGCCCVWEERPALGCSGLIFWRLLPCCPFSFWNLCWFPWAFALFFFFFVFFSDAGDAIVIGVAGDGVDVAGDSGTAGFLGSVLVLILVSFQMVELALFVLEGVRLCLFPTFSGTPSSFWPPRSSPPGCLFWAGRDAGLAPLLACWWWWSLLCLLLLLWLLPFHCFRFFGGKTWRYGRFVYTPMTLGVFPPPPPSFAGPRLLGFQG